MKMQEIKKEFIRDNQEWIYNNKNDIVMINYEFNCYIDGLCKDGIITYNQYYNATGFKKSEIEQELGKIKKWRF